MVEACPQEHSPRPAPDHRHLLGVPAALPAPTEAGERFRSDPRRTSGSLYRLPATTKTFALSSLAEEGTRLAGRILSAVDEMPRPAASAPQPAPGSATPGDRPPKEVRAVSW